MIDTILLKIPHPKFAVTRYDYFMPHAGGLFHEPWLSFPPNQKYIKCINNPSKEDKLRGIYRPRLTIIKRVGAGKGGFGINLHIELSLPKFMFGNNFDELQNTDWEDLIMKLKRELLFMGVIVKKEDLMDAPVHAVHFSKNIVFTDHTTASLILGYLEKIKVNQRLDLNSTEYRNHGEAVRYYAKSHELVFYDKVADLKKSKDRATEKDDREQNLQMSFFDQLRRDGQLVEVVRIELRLKSRQKMKLLFQKLGIENDLTFWSMFSDKLSQRLLLNEWDAIYTELRPVLLQELKTSELLPLIARQRPQWTPKRVLSLVAVHAIISDVGYRKFRTQFIRHFSARVLQRMYADLKELDFKILNKAKPFEYITQTLHDFKSLKKKDFTLGDDM